MFARHSPIHDGVPCARTPPHQVRGPGTTTVRAWPRPGRRAAYVRIARTPPAMRRCGQRKVTRTRSDGHRDLAGAPVRGRIERDVETPHVVRGQRGGERRTDLRGIAHED